VRLLSDNSIQHPCRPKTVHCHEGYNPTNKIEYQIMYIESSPKELIGRVKRGLRGDNDKSAFEPSRKLKYALTRLRVRDSPAKTDSHVLSLSWNIQSVWEGKTTRRSEGHAPCHDRQSASSSALSLSPVKSTCVGERSSVERLRNAPRRCESAASKPYNNHQSA